MKKQYNEWTDNELTNNEQVDEWMKKWTIDESKNKWMNDELMNERMEKKIQKAVLSLIQWISAKSFNPIFVC